MISRYLLYLQIRVAILRRDMRPLLDVLLKKRAEMKKQRLNNVKTEEKRLQDMFLSCQCRVTLIGARCDSLERPHCNRASERGSLASVALRFGLSRRQFLGSRTFLGQRLYLANWEFPVRVF